MQALPFSEFTRLLKAATMLEARDRLTMINVTNFAQLKPETRTSFAKDLKRASTQFLETRVKDYREVLANIARGLKGGGR